MKITTTSIDGVMLLAQERYEDERGWFARTYDSDALAAHGVDLPIVETSVSWSARARTLRGMHYQLGGEPKLVRCTAGRIFDVAVDLRPDSQTYRSWVAHELTSDAGTALFIPSGCAHGFLTLVAGCEVLYYMGVKYDPSLARGVRWDDPAFAIRWPQAPRVLSERDATYPLVDA